MSHLDTSLASGAIVNVSRRALLGGAGALALAFALPPRAARAAPQPQAAPASGRATHIAAFLTINPDETIDFRCPFSEGGQGVFTSIPQVIAEELDADVARFRTTSAPAGPDYLIMFGDKVRLTGGSSSVRTSFNTFRTVGATARGMLVQAAAARWGVPEVEVTTRPGECVHEKSDRTISYGKLAADAAKLPVPTGVALKDPSQFRLIGKPIARTDARAKSTGAAQFGIDTRLDGMLYAAVKHAPINGSEPADVDKQDVAKGMPGVHSVHKLPGAVAVVANSFFRARKAVDALEVTWTESKQIPSDFSSSGMLASLKSHYGDAGAPAESVGDAAGALKTAAKILEAEYGAPYLAHATLEPQNSTARWNAGGTLELWVPNQGPEFFQAYAAKVAGIEAAKIIVHSPLLGGFFGRRFIYGQEPMTQAILLSKAVAAPVKVVWTREEDFARDHYRPLSTAKLRAGLGADGLPVALHITAPGEGPLGRHLPFFMTNPTVDRSVVEGLTQKPYAIANRRIDYVKVTQPTNIGFWRSVGNSMNTFFYEAFLDECAKSAGRDPFDYRLALLKDNARLTTLLKSAADLAGGWKGGVYSVGGQPRAMGVAMASPFGSETATIAEISVDDHEITVHRLWIAVDPGSIVNPAIIEAQVQSAAAIGLSQALLEEYVFEDGRSAQTNFDTYPILPPGRMPKIDVRIVESGALMGGIGEIGTPGVAPAVANALAVLTGQRVRSLPMSQERLKQS